MPRQPKHPFHYDTYHKLRDQFESIVKSNDRRLFPEVRRTLEEAEHVVWQAWNLQMEMERAAGLRDD